MTFQAFLSRFGGKSESQQPQVFVLKHYLELHRES